MLFNRSGRKAVKFPKGTPMAGETCRACSPTNPVPHGQSGHTLPLFHPTVAEVMESPVVKRNREEAARAGRQVPEVPLDGTLGDRVAADNRR